MKNLFTGFSLLGAIAFAALAMGCASTQSTENKVTLAQRDGKIYYVFADPAHNQIYVGNPSQYQKYQQLRLANSLAQDQLATAELNNETAMGWGMWGAFY